MREDLFAIAALFFLCAGSFLGLGSIDIPGVDIVLPFIFAATVTLGLFSRRATGQASAALGLAALLLHLGILILA